MVLFSLKRLEENYDVNLVWHAYELRPAGSPPISPEYMQRIEQARPVFNQRMKDEFGVDIQSGPFGIVSRSSLLVDKYAEAQGNHAFHDATLKAYWHEGRDISSHAELAALMREAGLDANQLETILSDPTWEAKVDDDIELAREYGLDGVPAVVFGNKYLVMGAQPYPALERALQQLMSESE